MPHPTSAALAMLMPSEKENFFGNAHEILVCEFGNLLLLLVEEVIGVCVCNLIILCRVSKLQTQEDKCFLVVMKARKISKGIRKGELAGSKRPSSHVELNIHFVGKCTPFN